MVWAKSGGLRNHGGRGAARCAVRAEQRAGWGVEASVCSEVGGEAGSGVRVKGALGRWEGVKLGVRQ